MKTNFEPIIYTTDDNLLIYDAHIWAEKKYNLFGGYCNIFTTGRRQKWDVLVYIDLFSGPGYCRIIESGKIIKSSPLIALSLPVKFDVYIFCDSNANVVESLKKRVLREIATKEVHFLNLDSNKNIQEIKDLIPTHTKSKKVLSFCFADPYDLNLHFSTIQNLSTNKLIDLLILQAYFMDANRNYRNYINEDNVKISKYLGDNDWRQKFMKSSFYPNNFIQFLSTTYDNKMKSLKYLKPLKDTIKNPLKNVPLYYLTFYSKHPRGQDFYKKVQEYADDQLKLL